MRIEIPSHSNREDIHFINGDVMTVLSDQEIFVGDEITCPHRITLTHRLVYCIQEIQEKRRPMGDWKSERPNLYKIRFRKELEKLNSDANK